MLAKASGGALALVLSLTALPAAAQAPLPSGWPYQTALELGVINSESASTIRSWSQLKFRYAYLANGWRTWDSPDGEYARGFIQNGVNAGMTPVLTYYELLTIGTATGAEDQKVRAHLASVSAMQKWYANFKVLLQKAAGFPNNKIIVHVEPDAWGYMQQKAAGDDAATVPAAVSSTGFGELAGLPNTAAGFAQALVRMRDLYAPNVILGYHFTAWGTGFAIDGATMSTVGGLATRSANFYRSLGAGFDVTFFDSTDRDAGFRGSGAFWDSAKYDKHIAWLDGYGDESNQRLVLWQVPLGNRVMRSMNNTTNHYQSFQVEDLLGQADRAMLKRYRDIGVIAVLFGAGASDQTHYTDRARDGITNPTPINGNDRPATVADDDGGYFRERVKAYYAAGALPLDGGTSPPPATYSATGSISPTAPSVGTSTTATVAVTWNGDTSVSGIIVQLMVSGPNGHVCKRDHTGQSFAPGQTISYSCSWTPTTAGSHAVKVGTFSSDWSINHYWNGNVLTFGVGN